MHPHQYILQVLLKTFQVCTTFIHSLVKPSVAFSAIPLCLGFPVPVLLPFPQSPQITQRPGGQPRSWMQLPTAMPSRRWQGLDASAFAEIPKRTETKLSQLSEGQSGGKQDFPVQVPTFHHLYLSEPAPHLANGDYIVGLW